MEFRDYYQVLGVPREAGASCRLLTMNDTLIHALLDDTRLSLDELSGIGRVGLD